MYSKSLAALSVRACALALALVLTSCGGSDSSNPTPTGELTEEQIQQLKDLDEQRQSEWGTKQ